MTLKGEKAQNDYIFAVFKQYSHRGPSPIGHLMQSPSSLVWPKTYAAAVEYI